jgi:uncharacterized protein
VKSDLFEMSRKRRRVVISALAALAFLVGNSSGSGRAQNERVNLQNGTPVRTSPRGKLVFMLTTGFEDLVEVKLCLEDIKASQKSGYLEDLIWLVRGRGVDALGTAEGVLTRPPEIVSLAREVKAAGVRIIASSDAVKQQKIPLAKLDPKPTDLVDDSGTLLAELVSQNYQIIRY